MEIKKISKIQFRQDSEANFRAINPVLDQGEPAYCTDTDTLYIGKEGVPFSQLQPQSSSSAITVDVPDNGDLYLRRRFPNQTGAWVNVQARYNEKTFADIIKQPYGEELDMNFDYIDNLGIRTHVYAQRFLLKVNQNANTFDTQSILNPSETFKVKKILQVGGTIMADQDHEYMIPSSTASCTCNVVFDKQHSTVSVNSTSTSDRTEASIDLWVIYTR